jgi:ATP-dependent RNA helicase RhlE
MSTGADQSGPGFYGLGIASKILDILERIKFKEPTPIQRKAIPLAIEGKDVIGIAQTGTGKTHAYAVPMIQRLVQKKGLGLVLAPTRELAVQIDEAVQGIAHPFGMRTACLIGGASMGNQIQALRKSPRVITATPGRLIDHLNRRTASVHDVNVLVLDEADRMLDMGFAPQIAEILRHLPRDRQTMLFSASIPREIMDIAARYMKLPVRVEVALSGTAAENITQELFIVKKDNKMHLLKVLLAQYRGSVLLFVRTKHNATRIKSAIKVLGHSVAEIHSNRTLNQRREALEGFKSGKYKVLVATDIAARGLDVTGIELVINYEIPDDAQNYIHRIGRTGRAGRRGHAISFATPDQGSDVREVEKIARMSLPISKHPQVLPEEFYKPMPRPVRRKFHRPLRKRR